MKKRYIFYLLLACSLFSCSSAYHAYVVAENPELDYNPKDGFIQDFDSVKIFYTFKGMNMPLYITIDNQSKKSLFIDWNKSAFVVNGNLHSVVNPDSHTDITSNFNQVWDGESYYSVQITKKGELPIKFIPAKTKYTFLVRSFFEWAPTINQLENMPELDHTSIHPTTPVLSPTIFQESMANYPSVRAILKVQFGEQAEKVLDIDQTFYMTQQYKVSAEQGTHGTMRYADRGYYIYSDAPNAGSAVGGVLGLAGGLLLLLVIVSNP